MSVTHPPIAPFRGNKPFPTAECVVVLVVEGMHRLGLPPGRGMPRVMALGRPDGTAISWRLVAESRWKRPAEPPSPDEADPVEWPSFVVSAFLEAVAGRRIVAFHPKESARYLRRLMASAEITSVPPLEDYEAVSSDLGMNPIAYSYVLRLVEQRCLHFGVPLAAQLASGHLHLTAWQPNGPVRGEPRSLGA